MFDLLMLVVHKGQIPLRGHEPNQTRPDQTLS